MSKIAESIYKSDIDFQRQYPEYNINVGRGFRRNTHNLKDVIEIAKAKIREQNIYVKYNICTEEEVAEEIKVNEQFIRSCEKTIKELNEF